MFGIHPVREFHSYFHRTSLLGCSHCYIIGTPLLSDFGNDLVGIIDCISGALVLVRYLCSVLLYSQQLKLRMHVT